MNRPAPAFRAALAGMALLATLAAPARAQEPTSAHLDAARAAIGAIRATDQFDNILLAAGLNLKSQLIQANPDKQDIISATVDEVTLSLAGRRGDLENEAARVYANYFSETELAAIAEFYESEAGRKLLQSGPQATRDVLRAADIWSRGVARDLQEAVSDALSKRLGATGAPTVAEDGTPKAPQAQ